MGAAVRERYNVVYLSRLGIAALVPAYLAQWVCFDVAAPDGWPRAVVPVLHFWRPLISVVPGGDQPFMFRAVRFVGQVRAAGIPTRFPGFPGHSHLHSKRAADSRLWPSSRFLYDTLYQWRVVAVKCFWGGRYVTIFPPYARRPDHGNGALFLCGTHTLRQPPTTPGTPHTDDIKPVVPDSPLCRTPPP